MKQMFKYGLIAAAVLLFASPAMATAVVASWSPDRIVIGADSKTTYFQLDGTTDKSKDANFCKIHVSDNIAWVYVGLNLSGDQGGDLESIIDKALSSREGDFKTRTAAADAEILDRLQASLAALRQQKSKLYRNRIVDAHQRFGAVFGMADSGTLRFHSIQLTVNDSGQSVDIELSQQDCPEQCGVLTGVALGSEGLVADFSRQMRKAADAPEVAKGLIQAQIQASPDEVGSPISIFEIGRDGGRWTNQGLCE